MRKFLTLTIKRTTITTVDTRKETKDRSRKTVVGLGFSVSGSSFAGFTLVELLVVLSVLGLLLAFFVPPMISRIITNARRVATLQELNTLREAIMGNPDVRIGGEMVGSGFKHDVGRLPRHLVELATRNPFEGIYASVMYLGKETLAAWDPYIQKGWNGPYIREDGEMGYCYDAWNGAYRYWVEGNDTLGLESPGPDGLFWGQPGSVRNDDIKVRF